MGATRRRLDDGSDDLLIREEPLLIRVHDAQLLTMRTPGADRDLALGFLLGEGVVQALDEVLDVVEHPGDPATQRADEVQVALRDPARARIQGRLTRTHEIRPSCGLCGLTDADALLDELPPLWPGGFHLDAAALDDRRRRFEADQPLFTATGASHAAMLFGPDGTVWGRGEDVGRHNALDKAIGQALSAGHPLPQATAMLSGRAGADLVLKCLRAAIPVILSVSAPSALAADLCRGAGAALVGFLRPDRYRVYCSGRHRIR